MMLEKFAESDIRGEQTEFSLPSGPLPVEANALGLAISEKDKQRSC